MTLVEALKKHTGCEHELEENVLPPGIAHKSPLEDGRTLVVVKTLDLTGETVAEGSAAFHEAARWLLALEEHVRHPMNISDDEYAEFVNA